MNARKLLGKEVLDVHGNRVGKVADLDIDIVHGVINHVVVKAGLVKKYEIKVNEIVTIGDRVILSIDADKLENKSP